MSRYTITITLAIVILTFVTGSTVQAGLRGHANLYQLALKQQQQQQQLEHEQSFGDAAYLETNFFDIQRLDHFNELDNRTWSQRYYINTQFEIKGQYTPIFVYIGGEGELTNSSVLAGEIWANAKLHNATLVGLEHRYYGKSVPQMFDTLETKNLEWLTSQQALADLAFFLKYLQSIRTDWDKRPIFTWGGSYPGALAAWFRIKYPHITVGSVASSAPVYAVEDFFQYDEVVSASLGSICADKIRQATTLIEGVVYPIKNQSQADAMKAAFNCSDIENNVSFLYALADAVAYAVQYSRNINGTQFYGLCEVMEQQRSLVDNYATFFKDLIFNRINTTCVDFSTSEEVLNNTEIDADSAGRQWYYQSCNEFGYFQTAPANASVSIRSKYINVTYHEQLCETVFGKPIKPHVNFTNDYYGGDEPAGSNIIFVNGNIDPWHVLSVLHPVPDYPTQIPILINGTSHCADLRAANDTTDPIQLTQARSAITNIIKTVLNKQQLACPDGLTVCSGRCADILNDPHHCGACGNDITTQSNRYCSLGRNTDASPESTIGHELIIIGGVCTIIGIIALLLAVYTLRKAKAIKQHGLLSNHQEYMGTRA